MSKKKTKGHNHSTHMSSKITRQRRKEKKVFCNLWFATKSVICNYSELKYSCKQQEVAKDFFKNINSNNNIIIIIIIYFASGGPKGEGHWAYKALSLRLLLLIYLFVYLFTYRVGP